MAILINNVAIIVASNSSQTFGPILLPNNTSVFSAILKRFANATPFLDGEVRQLTIDLLLSTDGGLNFISQGGIQITDGIVNSNEPSGMGLFLEIPKTPNRQIRMVVASQSSALVLTGTVSIT